MPKKDVPNLLAIKEAIVKIDMFASEHFDGESLYNDTKSFDATLMNFIVIGESVSRMSEETLISIHDIPWDKIKGFRNIVAHNYFGIDAEEVFEIIKNDLPLLFERITLYLDSLE